MIDTDLRLYIKSIDLINYEEFQGTFKRHMRDYSTVLWIENGYQIARCGHHR